MSKATTIGYIPKKVEKKSKSESKDLKKSEVSKSESKDLVKSEDSKE